VTRTLLIIVAVGAILAVVSLSVLHALGGFAHHHHRHGEDADNDSGPQVTRELPWTGGDTLKIEVPAKITYTQGPEPKFVATGPKAIVDKLTLEDGELSGDPHRSWWRFSGEDRLTIAITSPNTHAFHLSGAEALTLKQYDQDELDLEVSGAAHVDGQGHAKRLDAGISGTGDLDLAQLPVDEARVSISGAGAATIDPKASADISISGAGHVQLKTTPPVLNTHVSGLGSVSHP
jgi:hypothetical protein